MEESMIILLIEVILGLNLVFLQRYFQQFHTIVKDHMEY